MLRCPNCSEVVKLGREPLPVILQESSDTSHKFKVEWVVIVPVLCHSCGHEHSIAHLTDNIGRSLLISEGAKALSSINPNRFNKQTGTDAANKRHSKKRT